MASPDILRFQSDLADCRLVVLDANVLIYQLEGMLPYVELTSSLMTASAGGSIRLVICALTVAEILAGPYRHEDPSRVAVVQDFLQSLPNATIQPIDFGIADRAAWLRNHGLRMPDAIVMATAFVVAADALVTNDIVFQRAIRGAPKVLLLDEYSP